MNYASIIQALNIKNAFDEVIKSVLNLDPQVRNVNILQGTMEYAQSTCGAPLVAVSRKNACADRKASWASFFHGIYQLYLKK